MSSPHVVFPVGLALALGVASLALSAQSVAACTKSWASAVDGNWSDGAKWAPSGQPSSGDDVCIVVSGTYTVTVDTAGTTRALTLGGPAGLQTLDLGGGNLGLAIGADASIGARGLVTMEGVGGYSVINLLGHTLTNAGTIRTFPGGSDSRRFLSDGALANSGTLDLQGGATDAAFGGLSVSNTGSMVVAASQAVDFQTITHDAGTIANHGAVLVKSAYTQGGGATTNNPIVLGNGATLILAGMGAAAIRAGGDVSIAGGPLTAAQTLDLPGGNAGAFLANDLASAGLITMEGTGGYSVLNLNGHTLTNTGTLRTFAGGSDGRRFLNNGSLANAGTLDLQGGATDASFGALSLANAGTIAVAASQQVDIVSVADGAGTIANQGSILVKGSYTQGDGTTSGNPIVLGNGATVHLTGSGTAAMQAASSVTVAGGPLAVGQSLDLPGGNSGAMLANDIANAGVITMEGAAGFSILNLNGHTLTNTGTLRTFAGGSDGRRFLNNGTLANAGTLDLQGGATDAVFGALALTNTTAMTVAAGQSVDVVDLTNDTGTITNDGAVLVKSRYTQGEGTAFGNPIVIGNGATLVLAGTGSAAMQAGGGITVGGGPLAVGQSLDLPGGNSGAVLANDLTSTGLITMEGTGGFSILNLAGHTLTNAGTLRTFPGGSDARRFLNDGTLANSGTLDLQGGATDAVFGVLSLTNSNALVIAAAQAVDVVNLANAGGTITNVGSLLVKGTYEQGGGAAVGNPVVVGEGGILSLTGPGSATIQAGGDLTVAGGPLAVAQRLDLPGGNHGALLANDLTNAGLITMAGVGGYSIVNLAGHTLTNAGTLRTIPGGSDARRFLNNGALVNTGALDLQGGATDSVFGAINLTNQQIVTIGVGQVLELQSGSFTQTAAGTLAVDHDATPAIGHVTTSSTATLAGCIGGTGPLLPLHTMLTAITARTVTGTFSCTSFAGLNFDVAYTATQAVLDSQNAAPTTTTTSTTTTSLSTSTTTTTTRTTTTTTTTGTSSTSTTTTSGTSTSSTSAPPTTTTTLATPTSTSTSTTSTTNSTTTTLAACSVTSECDDHDVCNGAELCQDGACRAPAQASCTAAHALAIVPDFAGDAVTIVDLAVMQNLGTVGVGVGAGPWGAAWQPDGRRAWVTNRAGDSVSAIDPVGRALVATIPVPGEPLGIAVHPAGAPLYVTQQKTDAVAVIDPATQRITGTIAVGDGPAGIAVDHAGRFLYVANYRASTVSVVDTATLATIATVPVGHQPLAVAVDPDGSKVYVTAYADDVVSVIGTASHTVVGSIPVGHQPVGVGFTATGDRAFVADAGGASVSVVDTALDRVVAEDPVGREPLGVAIDPGSGMVWVASSKTGTLAGLDPQSGTAAATITVGGTPVAVGAFIGKPPDDCPTTALSCDDGDPLTRDGCDPVAGCTHQPLGDVAAVAAAATTLVNVADGLGTERSPQARRIQAAVTTLREAADAAVASGDAAGRLAVRRALRRLLHVLEKVRRHGPLGAAGARLLDVARGARRELAR